MHCAVVLQKASRFGHRGTYVFLLPLELLGELSIARLHHLVNGHVLFDSQFVSLTLHHGEALSVSQLALVACLRSFDSLQFLEGIGSHCCDFLFQCLLFVLFSVLNAFVAHSLLHFFRSVHVNFVGFYTLYSLSYCLFALKNLDGEALFGDWGDFSSTDDVLLPSDDATWVVVLLRHDGYRACVATTLPLQLLRTSVLLVWPFVLLLVC